MHLKSILGPSLEPDHKKGHQLRSQKTSTIHPKSPPKAHKNAPQIHLGTLLETKPEKSSPIVLSRVAKGAPNAPQKHPGGLLDTQLAHFCGQNAAIKRIAGLKHIFERFLVLFEGSDLENGMVFTSPNQPSLVLQKVRFLSLFRCLFPHKMLTFATRWHPERAKSSPRGAQERPCVKNIGFY